MFKLILNTILIISLTLNSALANIATAVAVGALTGGAGAAAMAGVMAGTGAAAMTKGTIEESMKYDETIVANNLTANNINITSGNDVTMISTNFFDTDGIKQDVDNTNNNNTTNSNIKLKISGELNISTATEQHESFYDKQEWGGDLSSVGRVMVAGAITGAAVGYGMDAGKFLGKFASSSISNSVLSAVVGGAGGALGEWIKDVKADYMKKTGNNVSTGESSIFDQKSVNSGWSDSKLGVNSTYEIDIITGKNILISDSTLKPISYLSSNKNPIFKGLNLLPGSPSFVDFHDALNISDDILNILTIPPAYGISQFNALYPYYPIFIDYKNLKKEKK